MRFKGGTLTKNIVARRKPDAAELKQNSEQSKENRALNNIEAGNLAMWQALNMYEGVVIYGEDAGFEGGVFRATQGLQKTFGYERVFDSTLAEATLMGNAVGMSVLGMRPIVEIQFQGFSFPIIMQLFTQAARMRNRTRGRFTCPIVVRMPMGGGIKALEHHSEALEVMFAHIPGLKVVMPSTPYDVKGLLASAVKDGDPVVFLEPKKIYRSFREEIPVGHYEVPIGKANVMIEGESLTVVTYGAQVHDSLEAIKILQKERPDISVELIDLRTIKPIDTATIIKSVKKTGRLLVVHEAVKSFSVSGEIIARVNEKAFEYLLAPPSRLAGYDITIPLAKGEKFQAIDPRKIVNEIKKVCDFLA